MSLVDSITRGVALLDASSCLVVEMKNEIEHWAKHNNLKLTVDQVKGLAFHVANIHPDYSDGE